MAGSPPGQGILARLSPRVAANFTLRLIQIHMCIIYFFAGASKLQGTAWWNGQAMWMVLGNLEYQSIDMTWLAWHPWAIELLSHFTVFWELTFCVLDLDTVFCDRSCFSSHWSFIWVSAPAWACGRSRSAMLIGCAAFLPPGGVAELIKKLARAGDEGSRPAAEVGRPVPEAMIPRS